MRVGSDLQREDRVGGDAADLRHVRGEVGRAERVPELRDDLPALVRERVGEPAAHLVAERVVRADRHDLPVPLLVGVLAEGVMRLARRPARDAKHVRDALPLRQVVGGHDG